MRFYFHTEDGHCFADDEGTELPDIASACVEASKVLGEFLRYKPAELWGEDELSLRVTDEQGLTLFIVSLSVTLGPAMNGRHPTIDADRT